MAACCILEGKIGTRLSGHSHGYEKEAAIARCRLRLSRTCTPNYAYNDAQVG